MDMTTLALAKAYTDEQRLAYPIDKVIVPDDDYSNSGGIVLEGTPLIEGEVYHILHDGKVFKTIAVRAVYDTGVSIELDNPETGDFTDLPLQVSYCIESNAPEDWLDIKAGTLIALRVKDHYVEGKTASVILPNGSAKHIDQKFIPPVPFFDLVEMGLPTIALGSAEFVYANDIDPHVIIEIIDALSKGPIRIRCRAIFNGYEFDCYMTGSEIVLPGATNHVISGLVYTQNMVVLNQIEFGDVRINYKYNYIGGVSKILQM